jgi:hypothetical protein
VSLQQNTPGRFLPPDDFLPARAQKNSRTAGGETEIFLTWGGAVYGPARADEITAGVRTSWFEEDTLFWFEGQTEWRPVEEFPGLQEGGHHTLAGRRMGAAPDKAPPLLPREAHVTTRSSGARTRYAGRRSGKSGSARRKGGRSRPNRLGHILVFGGVVAAITATLAALFLLMLF